MGQHSAYILKSRSIADRCRRAEKKRIHIIYRSWGMKMGQTTNIIELKHITKTYEDGYTDVSDFNIEVKHR